MSSILTGVALYLAYKANKTAKEALSVSRKGNEIAEENLTLQKDLAKIDDKKMDQILNNFKRETEVRVKSKIKDFLESDINESKFNLLNILEISKKLNSDREIKKYQNEHKQKKLETVKKSDKKNNK